LGDEPFAVINGDVYCDYTFDQLHQLAEQLKQSRDNAHLVLVDNPSHHPRGDFLLHDGRVIPEDNQTSSAQLTFSGIGIYQPALFANILRGSKAPLALLLREQIALGKVSGEHYQGIWVDVGTPQRLEELDKNLRTPQNITYV
jgi:MurNAc alpha-1-phosphate uridylyltransferase